MNYSTEVAADLVRSRAVKFRVNPPYDFTSGAKSPIYVDNRTLLAFVHERERIVRDMAHRIELVGVEPVEAIAGTATAGIPWAAWLSDRLELPMVYVRNGGSKGWGLQRSVEGYQEGLTRAVLVEDLVFTGGSTLRALASLREAGLQVDKAICIVTYNLDVANRAFAEAGIELIGLTDIEQIVRVAEEARTLSSDDARVVREWLACAQRNPATL